MDSANVKKCRKCGATLVGRKAHKLGLCSSCSRELGQNSFGIVTVATVVTFVVKKVPWKEVGKAFSSVISKS